MLALMPNVHTPTHRRATRTGCYGHGASVGYRLRFEYRRI